MGAEMEHGVGRHLLPEVTVERRERVGGGKAALEEQAHGIAFVAEARLNQHGNVAEVRPKDKELCTVGEVLPRGAGPQAASRASRWGSSSR